jgi:hypothetical protein
MIGVAAQAQSFKLEMSVERVCVNSANIPNTHTTEIIHLVLIDSNIGLITSQDTLALTLFKKWDNLNSNNHVITSRIYRDELHGGQLYWVQYQQARDGIRMNFTPLRPYNRKLYAINLKTI